MSDRIGLVTARRRRLRTAGLSLLVAAFAGLTALVPGTAGAFTASVTNSSNSAGTAASFKCQDTFDSPANDTNAYFEYRLSATAAATTEVDQSTTLSTGTYAGTRAITAATGTDACPRDNTAAPRFWSLDGTSSALTNATSITAPTTFSLAVWFKTSTVSRPIMGLGSAATGTNSAWDRNLSLNASGQAVFTVNKNTAGSQTTTVTSTANLANNAWHQVVATLSTTSMMRLYVDGVLVAGPTSTTTVANTNFWRIGSDGLSTPAFFSGKMRFAAAYKFELTASEIAAEYRNGT